jgi:hypothetical protein
MALNAEYDVFNTRAEAEKYLRKKSARLSVQQV